MAAREWEESEHIAHYLATVEAVPHLAEGQSVLLAHVPSTARRILDLGTGDGRLLSLVRATGRRAPTWPSSSEPMLTRARERFAGQPVEVLRHDLAEPLPELGRFEAVVSSLAIHHLEDERKRSLYEEAFAVLEPGGVFANLEHVASPTERLHRRFFAIGEPPEREDPSDRHVAVETQLGWLREVGFEDVDCYWKWLELAVLIGVKPDR